GEMRRFGTAAAGGGNEDEVPAAVEWKLDLAKGDRFDIALGTVRQNGNQLGKIHGSATADSDHDIGLPLRGSNAAFAQILDDGHRLEVGKHIDAFWHQIRQRHVVCLRHSPFAGDQKGAFYIEGSEDVGQLANAAFSHIDRIAHSTASRGAVSGEVAA